jgi:membrane protein implicated in regulation of membrane protease activity
MRNILITISIFFGVLGIVFVILPMGTIAFLPAGIALVLSIIAYFVSEKSKKKFPYILIVLFVVLLLSAGAKKVFVKDTVKVEKQFLKEKQESKQEAQKELEDLENLE